MKDQFPVNNSKTGKQKIATGFLVLLTLVIVSGCLQLFAMYWFITIPFLLLILAIKWSLKQLKDEQ